MKGFIKNGVFLFCLMLFWDVSETDARSCERRLFVQRNCIQHKDSIVTFKSNLLRVCSDYFKLMQKDKTSDKSVFLRLKITGISEDSTMTLHLSNVSNHIMGANELLEQSFYMNVDSIQNPILLKCSKEDGAILQRLLPEFKIIPITQSEVKRIMTDSEHEFWKEMPSLGFTRYSIEIEYGIKSKSFEISVFSEIHLWPGYGGQTN